MHVKINTGAPLGLLLTVILLFPSFVQLAHLSESHDHTVCFDHAEHVHSLSYDCSIQDFHSPSFHFLSSFKTVKELPSFIDLKESKYYYHSNKLHHLTVKSLRAPPYLS
jgi:hypothetical protein